MNLDSLPRPHTSDPGKSAARGVASLLVVLTHAYSLFLFPFSGPGIFDDLLGQLAGYSVMAFFVVSGMLITQSILKNIERHGNFNLVEYGISRFARIYPPLFFSIAICGAIFFAVTAMHLPGHDADLPLNLGLHAPARSVISMSWKDVMGAIFMNNGLLDMNGPLWSLCIEWRIYLLAGFLALALSARLWALKILGMAASYFAVIKLLAVNEHAVFYLVVWGMGALWAIFGHFLGRRKTQIVLLAACGMVIVWTIADRSMLTVGARRFGLADSFFQFGVCLILCVILGAGDLLGFFTPPGFGI